MSRIFSSAEPGPQLTWTAMTSFIISPPMLISFTSVLATLRLIFRSRAALELENLALQHLRLLAEWMIEQQV
jgi:hypothetical protein